VKPLLNCFPFPDPAACVEAALDAGVDALKLTREIAHQPGFGTHAARELVDTTSARLWLASGLSLSDVITMLEVRHRFELSPQAARVHAMDVVCAVRQAAVDNAKYEPIRNHKEPRHAAA
jgi:hypothetical protein